MIDDYLQSDDYKQKYEELMRRCEEFNIWFEDHKKKMGIVRIPTTTPWPPIGIQYTYNSVCKLCRMDLNKATQYVCHHPNCPSKLSITMES
jgi:hypothetical protein